MEARLFQIPGLLRKNNYRGRFEYLLAQANVLFDTLLTSASRNIAIIFLIKQMFLKGLQMRIELICWLT